MVVGVFLFIINNADTLKADILSQDPSSIDPTKGDMVYEIQSGQIIVFSNKFMNKVRSIQMSLVSDPESVQFVLSGIKSSYEYTYAQGVPGTTTLILTNIESIQPQDVLIALPLSWDDERVVLGQTTALFEDGSVDMLSVRKK